MQDRLRGGCDDDPKVDAVNRQNFKYYARFQINSKRPKSAPLKKVDYDIQPLVNELARLGEIDPDPLFQHIRTTCTEKQNRQEAICYTHNVLTSAGIVIAENINKSKDKVNAKN